MRIPTWLKYIFIFIVLILASAAILRSQFAPISSEQATPQPLREPFPDLELSDRNGEKHKLSQWRGKVVLVSFWASWCQPCLAELPLFAQIAQKYPGQLVILPINQDDDSDLQNFIDLFWQKENLPFATYYDPGFTLAKTVNLDVLPTNYLLDRQGNKALESLGAADWSSPDAQKLITDLLAEK